MDANPVIPWLGGKRRLADKLFPLFPKHDCYVELFCGGAALYFLRHSRAHCEVLNDVNGELVNLYRVIQHHLEEFVRQFKWALEQPRGVQVAADDPAGNADRHPARCPVLLPAAPCL